MKVVIKDGGTYPVYTMIGKEMDSYSVTPDPVDAFINGATYTETDVTNGTATKIKDYNCIREWNSDGSWTEQTRPVILVGSGATFTITDDDDSSFLLDVTADTGATKIYNLIPGRNYSWELADSNETILDSGSFTTTGSVRMIKIAIPNFRDLGGWDCYDSNGSFIGNVAYGRLYRGYGVTHLGGSWRSISGSDASIVNTLQWLGVTMDLDLRYSTSSGYQKATDPGYASDSGITYVHCPMASYDNVLDSNNVYYTYTKTALEGIAASLSSNGGVYIHCTTGADRTGTLCAILLAILGCSVDSIIKDWELTSFNGPGYDVYFDEYNSSNQNIRTFLAGILTKTGNTLQEKMIGWLTGTLGVARTTITTILSQMIVNH